MRGWVVVGAVMLLVSGCSATGVAQTPSPTASPLAVTVPMPDLGPEPTLASLSDDAAESQRLANQDEAWARMVSANYPNAVRPDVVFMGYTAEDDYLQILDDCYTAAGLTVDRGVDANGVFSGISVDRNTESAAVAAFVCDQAHPQRPRPKPSPELLGWFYDYLTEFLAPRYAANGIENPPAPTREYFVTNFPNQGWWPSPGMSPMGTARDDAINAACPSPR